MKKVKTISKYVVNTLNMINFLLVGVAKIWGFNVGKVSATIIFVAGVISAYLVYGKLFAQVDLGPQNKMNEDSIDYLIEEGEIEHVSNKK